MTINVVALNISSEDLYADNELFFDKIGELRWRATRVQKGVIIDGNNVVSLELYHYDKRVASIYKRIRKDNKVIKIIPSIRFANAFNNFSNNGCFIEVAISPSSKALLFLGQHYGTDVAKLIIFVLTETEVKLVFCKKMMIKSIVNNPNSFLLTLQSNILDGGQGQSIIHTIWKKMVFFGLKITNGKAVW